MAADEPTRSKRVRPTTERGARQGHGTIFYVLAFVAAVLVLNAVFGDHGALAMMRARREYDQLAAEVARMRQENAQLQDQARRLRDDPATIEDLARRKLGLIRRGEKVFIVSDVPPADAQRPAPAPQAPQAPNVPQSKKP